MTVTDETVRLNVRVSKEFNEWLDEKSKKTGVSKSALVYYAIDQFIIKEESYLTNVKNGLNVDVLSLINNLESLQQGLKELAQKNE